MSSIQAKHDLLPFADALADANAAELAERTLIWARKKTEEPSLADILGDQVVALSVVASVFQAVCAPISPTDRFLDLGARLVLVFLSADDNDPSDIPEPSKDQQWQIGAFTPYLRRWLSEFEEFTTARTSDRERFIQAYHDYLRARRHEPQHTQELTVEQHWASRRKTIFSDPFVTQSILSLQIDTGPFEQYIDECLDHIANTAWLANDLGSIGRDLESSDPDDLNIINTYMRQHGYSHARAFDHVVDDYNHTVERLKLLLDRIEREVHTPDTETFTDLVRANVRGNLDAMKALRFRYNKVDLIFDRLDLIR